MNKTLNMLETEALLQIIALGDTAFDSGKGIPASDVFAELRRKKGVKT